MNTSNTDTSSTAKFVDMVLAATLNGCESDPEVIAVLDHWKTQYSKSLTVTSDPPGSLAAERASTLEALITLTESLESLVKKCKRESKKLKHTSKKLRKLERKIETLDHSSKHRETASDDEYFWETASEGTNPGLEDAFATMSLDQASRSTTSETLRTLMETRTSNGSEEKDSTLSKSSKHRCGKGKGKRSGDTGTESGDESE